MTGYLDQREVRRLGGGRGWGISRKQWFTLLWHYSCFDLSFVCTDFLEPLERIEDRLPVVVGEVVLDLVDVHVRRSDPVCGGELICT